MSKNEDAVNKNTLKKQIHHLRYIIKEKEKVIKRLQTIKKLKSVFNLSKHK